MKPITKITWWNKVNLINKRRHFFVQGFRFMKQAGHFLLLLLGCAFNSIYFKKMKVFKCDSTVTDAFLTLVDLTRFVAWMFVLLSEVCWLFLLSCTEISDCTVHHLNTVCSRRPNLPEPDNFQQRVPVLKVLSTLFFWKEKKAWKQGNRAYVLKYNLPFCSQTKRVPA